MSSKETFVNEKYDVLYLDHEKKAKRILKKNLSKVPDTLVRYEHDILTAHNLLIEYVAPFYSKFDDKSKKIVDDEIVVIRDRTSKCIARLNSSVVLPQNWFELIPVSAQAEPTAQVTYSDDEEEEDEELASANTSKHNLTLTGKQSDTNTQKSNDVAAPIDSSEIQNTQVLQSKQSVSSDSSSTSRAENLKLQNEIQSPKLHRQSILNSAANSNSKIVNMPDTNENELTKVGFIKFATNAMKTYSGDPLALRAFVNSINLCVHMSNKKYDDVLKDVILTKLEGKAYECIDPDKSTDEIISALTKHIKPENSKVIAGRMTAFKMARHSATDFAQKAEDLAEAFQRSLIIEGITREKAQEMTIEKTVEMCRQNAKSDLVRSVLAASKFNDPKEVISKMITEQSATEKDHQVLHFRSNNKRFQKSNNFRGNGRYRNFNRNFNGNGHNGNNNYNNGGGNGNWRGRGGKFHRGGRRNAHIRVTENSSAPLDERREASEPQFRLERAIQN